MLFCCHGNLLNQNFKICYTISRKGRSVNEINYIYQLWHFFVNTVKQTIKIAEKCVFSSIATLPVRVWTYKVNFLFSERWYQKNILGLEISFSAYQNMLKWWKSETLTVSPFAWFLHGVLLNHMYITRRFTRESEVPQTPDIKAKVFYRLILLSNPRIKFCSISCFSLSGAKPIC